MKNPFRTLITFAAALSCLTHAAAVPAESTPAKTTGNADVISLARSSEDLAAADERAASLVAAKNMALAVGSTDAPQAVDTYDAAGRLVRREVWRDGKLETRTFYYYGVSGAALGSKEVVYDAAGWVAFETWADGEGRITHRREFAYDVAGRLVRVWDRGFEPASGRLVEEGVIEYAWTGSVRRTVRTFARTVTATGAERTVERRFDPSTGGRIDETRVFTSAHGFRTLYEVTDAAGRIVERVHHRADGTVRESSVYDEGRLVARTAHDAAGRAVSRTWYAAAGGARERVVEYDAATGRVVRVTLYAPTGAVARVIGPELFAGAPEAAAWFAADQATTPSGLIVSHPDDPSFIYHEGIVAEWAKIFNNTQAFTYDQALAGIAMLNAGDLAGAKEILDFFAAERAAQGTVFTGFYTVYNVDPAVAWKRYEWRKGAGENAWIGLFFLHYEAAVTDAGERARARELAATVGRWLASLPHHAGAIAMGPDTPGAAPNYGRLYSAENVLDQHAFFKALLLRPVSGPDRTLFERELAGVTGWLKDLAYDRTAGLFRRGGKLNAQGAFEWDPVASLDVQTWAVSAIGPMALEVSFNIDAGALLERAARVFAVAPDGSFGGPVFDAKGFDFSDAANARAIGRPGIKWVEGTEQMILALRQAAAYLAAKDRARAARLGALADRFEERRADEAIAGPWGVAYPYADRAGVQIYAGTGNWKTFTGQGAPSVGWVAFAASRRNPFDP